MVSNASPVDRVGLVPVRGWDRSALSASFAALANALYKATRKRFYKQPFLAELDRRQGGIKSV